MAATIFSLDGLRIIQAKNGFIVNNGVQSWIFNDIKQVFKFIEESFEKVAK